MCGFAGFTGYLENGKDVLTNMMNRIVHRGPDSAGQYIDDKAYMGFRRLGVFDEGLLRKLCEFAVGIQNFVALRRKLRQRPLPGAARENAVGVVLEIYRGGRGKPFRSRYGTLAVQSAELHRDLRGLASYHHLAGVVGSPRPAVMRVAKQNPYDARTRRVHLQLSADLHSVRAETPVLRRILNIGVYVAPHAQEKVFRRIQNHVPADVETVGGSAAARLYYAGSHVGKPVAVYVDGKIVHRPDPAVAVEVECGTGRVHGDALDVGGIHVIHIVSGLVPYEIRIFGRQGGIVAKFRAVGKRPGIPAREHIVFIAAGKIISVGVHILRK